MSPEAQRIAIAELAGWKYAPSKHGHYLVTAPDGNRSEPRLGYPAFDGETGAKIERHWADGVDLPDYLSDLNAIMPVVRSLKMDADTAYEAGSQFNQYIWELFRVCTGHRYDYGNDYPGDVVAAEPQQHCEAVLRALGKWDDSK